MVYFISQQFVLDFVLFITQNELSRDPNDFIANYMVNSAHNFSISSQHFAAFFLLSHGIVKLFLIIGLWQKKLWCYPTTIVVFGLLVVYNLYRFNFTHSIGLLLLTILDIFVIGLTWYEYNRLKLHE